MPSRLRLIARPGKSEKACPDHIFLYSWSRYLLNLVQMGRNVQSIDLLLLCHCQNGLKPMPPALLLGACPFSLNNHFRPQTLDLISHRPCFGSLRNFMQRAAVALRSCSSSCSKGGPSCACFATCSDGPFGLLDFGGILRPFHLSDYFPSAIHLVLRRAQLLLAVASGTALEDRPLTDLSTAGPKHSARCGPHRPIKTLSSGPMPATAQHCTLWPTCACATKGYRFGRCLPHHIASGIY